MNSRQKEWLYLQVSNEKKVLEEIKAIFEQAEKDIDDKIASLLGRQDLENLQSIIYQLDFQRALKTQINAILDDLNTKQFETVSKYLTDCYENGFLSVFYDLQGQGIPIITPIDQEQVVRAITTDSKLSKRLYTRLGEDVGELKKKVRTELSRGLAQNYTYAQIARNISNQTKIGMNRSMRIARTEGHRVSQQATFNAQVEAKKKGAEVVKQWDATLDGRTRPLHRRLDGQIKELDEKFTVGGYSAMYPSGFGVAGMDVNCRCVLLQRAVWALDEDELKTLQERAKFFGLDKTKDFDDFKDKYLRATT